ncbi:ribosomal RNA small subunit methyltransferase A [Candidatus Dojkabacteria bacterium]|nr:ribosomal RNA small subunit methyltransferase A [Candidatus Dojkabacteria bacterium]
MIVWNGEHMRKQHNFKKQFGQNFLKNVDAILHTIEALELKEGDYVIEIGPGDGRLTEYLINEPIELRAIEVDDELIPLLQGKFANYANFKLIHKDVLKILDEELIGIENFKVVGNLPYNISKPIIKKFIELENRPEMMVFTLQKEVARDYCAEAPKSSFLSNFVRVFYEVEYLRTIAKENFYPVPKVDGGVIKLTKKSNPEISEKKYEDFVKFLKNSFRSPRKQMKGVLKNIYREVNWPRAFEGAGIKLTARASELRFEDFVNLFHHLDSRVK